MRFISTNIITIVVLPTYNNASTLPEILDRLAALQLPLLVVNDGSTDGTGAILDSHVRSRREDFSVLSHPRNLGKAAALLTGFRAAKERGFTHAVTLDTDGQLDPEQVPELLAACSGDPSAMVLGYRDDTRPDYPAASRTGRKISNLMVRLECGRRVADSQCGFRAYPLEFVLSVPCRAGRFGYETEILTRAAWAGCPFVEVPVNCRYFAGPKRITHFKVVRDSLRGVAMHARLTGRALAPWPHHRVWPLPPDAQGATSIRAVVKRMRLRNLWREVRFDYSDRVGTAAAIALGVYIAALPTYPCQTVLAIYAGKRLHLNPLLTVLGSHASMPPVGWAMIAAEICLGHLLLWGQWLPMAAWSPQAVVSAFGKLLAAWVVGSLILGGLLAVLAFLLTLALMRLAHAIRRPGGEKERRD